MSYIIYWVEYHTFNAQFYNRVRITPKWSYYNIKCRLSIVGSQVSIGSLDILEQNEKSPLYYFYGPFGRW